jgi:hypothetical protein
VTGNLKASQTLLNHASIQTTADIYSDWDIDQLTATMTEVLDSESVQSPGSKNPRGCGVLGKRWRRWVRPLRNAGPEWLRRANSAATE